MYIQLGGIFGYLYLIATTVSFARPTVGGGGGGQFKLVSIFQFCVIVFKNFIRLYVKRVHQDFKGCLGMHGEKEKKKKKKKEDCEPRF